MKIIWLNFLEVIPNTLREIKFLLKKYHIFRLQFVIHKCNWYIEVVYGDTKSRYLDM